MQNKQSKNSAKTPEDFDVVVIKLEPIRKWWQPTKEPASILELIPRAPFIMNFSSNAFIDKEHRER